MKTKQVILFASGLLLFTSLNSCKPKSDPVNHEPDLENRIENNEERIVITEAELEKDRAEFKRTSEIRIEENDRRIEELRAKMATADDRMKAEYNERIDELNERNKKQRERLNDYKGTGNENWEKFKREFNHDMDELGDALKNFGNDNKK
ncbi:MAG: hypothetical protein K0S12_1040 [Bacteroidetes bacterium]|nr:hypothetical protein [Bacteroidota bacterium]